VVYARSRGVGFGVTGAAASVVWVVSVTVTVAWGVLVVSSLVSGMSAPMSTSATITAMTMKTILRFLDQLSQT
jgi:hypothetical protein